MMFYSPVCSTCPRCRLTCCVYMCAGKRRRSLVAHATPSRQMCPDMHTVCVCVCRQAAAQLGGPRHSLLANCVLTCMLCVYVCAGKRQRSLVAQDTPFSPENYNTVSGASVTRARHEDAERPSAQGSQVEEERHGGEPDHIPENSSEVSPVLDPGLFCHVVLSPCTLLHRWKP